MALRVELEDNDVEVIDYALSLIVSGFVPTDKKTETTAKEILCIIRGS